MTIAQLRTLIRDLPDETEIELTNLDYSEWYGIETLKPEAVRVYSGKLVIDFGNSEWTDEEYRYHLG